MSLADYVGVIVELCCMTESLERGLSEDVVYDKSARLPYRRGGVIPVV